MSPPGSSALKAAKPTRNIFDAWNSSATGHQRAENRLGGSTAWRDSRTAKLREQLTDGHGGGAGRTADTVGAGSEHFGEDGRLENGGWEKRASGLRGKGQRSLTEAFAVGKSVEAPKKGVKAFEQTPPQEQQQQPREKQIFAGLTFYVNGSTMPLISDHKLKRLLASHGGSLSIALGRRSVTHVILGAANGSGQKGEAGGGLAASKIQKEVSTVRGKGIRFVSAEWVLESVKQGKRVPEGRYLGFKTAMKEQRSVGDMFAA